MLRLPALRRQAQGLGWWPVVGRRMGVGAASTPAAPAVLRMANDAAPHRARPRGKHGRGPQPSPAASSEQAPPSYAHLPTCAIGQVMSATANYVRVDIHQLGSGEQGGGDDAAPGAAAAVAAAQPALPRDLPHTQLLCTMRAMLKKVKQTVLVGDRVEVANINWREGRGQVQSVFSRASELVDPAVANVDHVLLLFGLRQPPFEEQQVTRFLVSIEAAGLPLTLALNKADLLSEAEVAERVAQCAAWGYAAVPISCETGRGLDGVAAVLAGRTSVVAGPSGAGKTSLINALRLGKHRPDADMPIPIPLAALEGLQQRPPPSWLDVDTSDVAYDGPPSTPAASSIAGGGGVGSKPASSSSSSEEEQEWGFWNSGEEDDWGDAADKRQQRREARDAAAAAASSDSGAPAAAQQPVPGPEPAGSPPAELDGSWGDFYGADELAESAPQPGAEFLAVGEMSRMGRGKHTTTSVSLIPLPGGGLLADTPGFNRPTLELVPSRELALHFPEFREAIEAAGGCRFTDCQHLLEPGCAVNEREFERYEYYLKLLAEIQTREEYDVKVMQLGKKQREGTVKEVTGRGGKRRFEARLDAKKHRATSRRATKQRLLDAAAEAEREDL